MNTPPRLLPLVLLLAAASAPAQRVSSIVTDASTHPGQPLALQGPAYLIPEALGRLAGANLFHSFLRFGLASGESATFATQTPTLQNVIARVTGGQASQLQGLLSLKAAAGAPALFLINPAGVLFGEGARIDVPGAFLVSSAPRLRFAGGEALDTTQADSRFSAAAPEAFGFLGGQRAAPVLLGEGALLRSAGDRLQIAAGDLLLQGAALVGATGNRLSASGAAALDVPLDGPLPTGVDGQIVLRDGAGVSVVARGATPGGALELAAGSLSLEGGSVLASLQAADASAAGGAIDLQLAGALNLGGGSWITAGTENAAPGGALRVRAGSVALDGGAYLETTSRGAGAAGPLALQVDGLLSARGHAGLYSLSAAGGEGGAVQVQAGAIELSGGGYAWMSAQGAGRGGALQLRAAGALRIGDGGLVLNAVEGSGAGGDTLLQAGSALQIDPGGDLTQSTRGTGATGRLRLEAPRIALDGATVTHASVGGGGDTGSTELVAAERLSVAGSEVRATAQGGRSGDFLLQGGVLLIEADTLVLNSAQGAGAQAGSIRLHADEDLTLLGSQVRNLALDGGQAGDIALSARNLFIGADSQLLSRSLDADSGAGSLRLVASELLQVDGASSIQAFTHTNRAAGDILLQGGTLRLGPGVLIGNSALEGSGHAGSIELRASGLLSLDGALLNASSSSAGNAGQVILSGHDVDILGGSLIATLLTDTSSGQGGSVRVEAANRLLLGGASKIDSGNGSPGLGRGGAVNLTAGGELRLDEGALVASSTAGPGAAGSIALHAGGLLSVSGASELQAVTEGQGAAGSLQLSGQDIRIGGGALLSAAVNAGGSGAGGSVQLLAARDLLLTEQARVNSNNFGTGGAAGDLLLQAGRVLRIDGASQLGSATFGAGRGGSLQLQAPEVRLEGQAALFSSSFGGGGDAGAIRVAADAALSLDGASLNAQASGAGNAGQIALSAADIVLQAGSALRGSVFGSGNGDAVRVEAGRSLQVLGQSVVDSSSYGSGSAGRVLLSAGESLQVSGQSLVSSLAAGSGAAGSVRLQSAGELSLGGGSQLVANSSGAGAAGSIELQARRIVLDRALLNSSALGAGPAGQVEVHADDELRLQNQALVAAVAGQDSGGQTGSIRLAAGALLVVDDSTVSIANNARVPDPAALQPTVIRLQAPRIVLRKAIVSASATGNADASRIEIEADDQLDAQDSLVSTSAQDGNGGALEVSAGRDIGLRNSGLITPVLGEGGADGQGGNGGDIVLRAELLVMDKGFIQANTAADGARGGNVRIEVGAVLPVGGRLMVGGDRALQFIPGEGKVNVIQAAAPDGVSGQVAVSGQIDLAAALALLERRLLDGGGLGRGPCDRVGGSSLAVGGRGGLPAPTWPPPAPGAPQGAALRGAGACP